MKWSGQAVGLVEGGAGEGGRLDISILGNVIVGDRYASSIFPHETGHLAETGLTYSCRHRAR